METKPTDSPPPPGSLQRQAVRLAGRLGRSWFSLTLDEQRMIAAILALFILGVSVRAWRLRVRAPASPEPPPAAVVRP